MRQIRIDQNDHRFLSSWEEVGADLLLTILPHIYTEDRDTARAALVPLLSDIPPLILIQLTPGQYLQLAELTEWVWTEPLTVPIIPEIEHNGTAYRMPAECLYDSPFIEYDHLDNFMADLTEEDGLARITATILRPVGGDGQRIPFDGMQLDRLARQLEDLPAPYHLYAFHFAAGCLRYIREQYGAIWEQDGTGPKPDSRYDFHAGEENDFSWTGAAFRIAEEGVFGTYREVIFTDCHTVLYYLVWKKGEGRRLRINR